MLSARRCRLFVFVLTLTAITCLSGCDKPIKLALGQNNKIALYPTPGQHLVWLNGIQVKFLGLSPCTETGDWLTECHVKSNPSPAAEMQYFYICKDYRCSDPEVDVGSGNGGRDKNRLRTTRVMDSVAVYCNGSAVALVPADLPSDSENAPLKPGIVINWISVGSIQNWSVAFDTPGVCEEPSIQSDGNTMCTIKQGLAPNKYTYKASSTNCATPAVGTLTTVAP